MNRGYGSAGMNVMGKKNTLDKKKNSISRKDTGYSVVLLNTVQEMFLLQA